jgi:hypothetical protein
MAFLRARSWRRVRGSFVPVLWLMYSRNAPELDSISQANGNETLVLCSAVDGTPALRTNFTRHHLVGHMRLQW